MTNSEAFSTKEVDFVKRLLLQLHKRSYDQYTQQQGQWGKVAHHEFFRIFQPFSSAEWLEDRLPSEKRREGRLFNGKVLIFLDFIEKEAALPILDMRWDFRQGYPAVVRFLFFLLHWKGGEKMPQAVGFRLESPEGPGGERGAGNHNYWHGQMIAEFDKDADQIRTLLGASHRWIPTKQPAFPLPAKKMGDLFAVLLLSLYGTRQLGKFQYLDGFGDLAARLRVMGIWPA